MAVGQWPVAAAAGKWRKSDNEPITRAGKDNDLHKLTTTYNTYNELSQMKTKRIFFENIEEFQNYVSRVSPIQ